MKDGPAQFANAELIRYVDDCVILVRYVESQVTDWIEATVEDWFGLTINREKTKVFDLSEDGTRPGFLGYSLRYDKDRHGRNTRYLNLFVREASCKRRRGKISDLLGYHTSFVPIPELIDTLNLQLAGWKNYFRKGYPRKSFKLCG